MPDSGHEVHPFLSSVDNGWLAAGLTVVAAAEPSLSAEAHLVLDRMHFGVFHDAAEAADNLVRIERDLGAYGPGGFIDAVDTRTGRHAGRPLSLDQSMVLGALANVLADDCLRRWFCTPEVELVLRPVVVARRMPLG
jgi:hypothetical protein